MEGGREGGGPRAAGCRGPGRAEPPLRTSGPRDARPHPLPGGQRHLVALEAQRWLSRVCSSGLAVSQGWPASPGRAGPWCRGAGVPVPPSNWLVWGPAWAGGHSTWGRGPRPSRALSQPSFPRRRRKGSGKVGSKGGRTPLPRAPGGWVVGAAAGGSQAEAELRRRAQSWASPPATRGWLARCGRRPRRTGPWGRRRSACRRRTGSRTAPTGPRWRAGGSGGGTRGRCSRGRPGGGAGVRGAWGANPRSPRAGGAAGVRAPGSSGG